MNSNGSGESGCTGPLRGIRLVELGGIGPGPFCAMLLADLGADVVRVDRVTGGGLVGPNSDHRAELINRGRRSVAIDLKQPDGREMALQLIDRADVLIEGFRPGVTERLGLGPEDCAARNPGLVYGRMTGYGQSGPMSQEVGHDINYVALSGVLSMIGRQGQPPTPPLSLIGDFGGGGMLLALGVLGALVERRESGLGQVIDASMAEGAALLGTAFFGFRQNETWSAERGTNIVDSGAPFYDAYETADGKWLSVAAMEPHFYRELIELLDIRDELPDQNDRAQWPRMKLIFADAVGKRTRDEWVAAARGRSVCIAPVLDATEAAVHEHSLARSSFVEVDGFVQPAPAPRFSRTPAEVDRRPPVPGEHTVSALIEWGVPRAAIAAALGTGALRRGVPSPSSTEG
ncbi:CoA transferase [Nocardia sp. CA2R105]|uniref:CaiB/BaiF CoA transferase family protein n=1 Tax=Nocardia coffeae TaxID=2873381 RepID=UPI001CA6AE27|nr:CaiB/BaiF CoA-transferase family protein [Nocardia coffeae]MBY8857344.1 CoA transferase [Nocardia coffeae]